MHIADSYSIFTQCVFDSCWDKECMEKVWKVLTEHAIKWTIKQKEMTKLTEKVLK